MDSREAYMTAQNKITQIPWSYLLLAYALAWIFWIPLALTGRDYQSSPLLIFLMLVGVFGPGIAGIILTYKEGGREGGREFWQRAFDFHRIHPGWVGMILLFFPGLCLIAIAIYYFLNGSFPSFEMLKQMALQPASFLIIPFLYLIQAGFEELGWRGYMLDRVQAIWKPMSASLIVGVFHAFWHLPLFWVAGTNQITMGFGLDFWIFIGLVLAGSIYSTWCYNSNGRSILAVTLLHTASNLSPDLFTEPGMERRIYFLIVILGAIVVAAFWVSRMKPIVQPVNQEVIGLTGM